MAYLPKDVCWKEILSKSMWVPFISNANVEEFRGKLKLLLDESGVLIRKVKEVALVQKQKERDFIQARRAIERIRMAI